MESVTITNH
jgi:hypothetical protein